MRVIMRFQFQSSLSLNEQIPPSTVPIKTLEKCGTGSCRLCKAVEWITLISQLPVFQGSKKDLNEQAKKNFIRSFGSTKSFVKKVKKLKVK